tara:strand:- start:961 stop:1383 length:423 start_codon:yes stop_codon:yes gene_type:complete
MKKKVSSVKFQEDFPSQYGHFYKWLIEFQDGFQAEYLSKTETQNKFVEGQDVDVEISTRDYNGKKINKVKPVSNFQGGSRQAPKADNVQELIVKQNALTNACNVIGEADVVKIIEVAEVFSNWVLKGEKPSSTNSNDLPF